MSVETFLDGRVTLHGGDNRVILKGIPDCSIDSIVTDPPYALVSIVKRFGGKNAAAVKVPESGSGAYARASSGFMGKQWDTGETAFSTEFWAEVFRVLKPGGHVAAFGASRGYHRMAVAIEDAGFEIRDSLMWLYGTGFPKSQDVSKFIDKAAGATREVIATIKKTPSAGGANTNEGWVRPWAEGKTTMDITAPATEAAQEWAGWGTALKPAFEPIVLARKPLSEPTVAANVLRWRTGALNIDACRVEGQPQAFHNGSGRSGGIMGENKPGRGFAPGNPDGRWPANVIHDGSPEVLAGFPETQASSDRPRNNGEFKSVAKGRELPHVTGGHADTGGSAARFFYTPKADKLDRLESKHPTVKPVDLMQWLCRLVTPPGGTVLDPFAGTGTTGEAAFREGFKAALIEREQEYKADIRRRMALCLSGPDERRRESIKAKTINDPVDAGPLFAGAAE